MFKVTGTQIIHERTLGEKDMFQTIRETEAIPSQTHTLGLLWHTHWRVLLYIGRTLAQNQDTSTAVKNKLKLLRNEWKEGCIPKKT
jgi:hypothetical protein